LKTIIVCGGGYAGISFLRNFPDKKNFRIILIDRNPFHYLQPEVYGYIAHESLISDILIDLISLSAGISKDILFIKDKIISIDFDNNQVVMKNGRLKYDYLVFALGGKTFFPPIKGLREYSAGVKTIERSMDFKQSFEKVLLKKFKNETECSIDKNNDFNIVVGGGGLSGVEIASEMAFFQREIFKNSRCLINNTNIILIEALPSILAGLDPFIIENAYKRLKNLGVNIITGKKIVAVDKDKVVLEDGKEIKSDFLIWTGGLEGSSVIKRLENVKVNRRNQLIVDKFFRIRENVFAIGDSAEIRDFDTNEVLPPTAQIAIQSGKIVAKHIHDLETKKAMYPEYPKFKGIISALGGKYAVGMVGNIRIKGYPAYLLKQAVLKSYKLPLKYLSYKGYKEINGNTS